MRLHVPYGCAMCASHVPISRRCSADGDVLTRRTLSAAFVCRGRCGEIRCAVPSCIFARFGSILALSTWAWGGYAHTARGLNVVICVPKCL